MPKAKKVKTRQKKTSTSALAQAVARSQTQSATTTAMSSPKPLTAIQLTKVFVAWLIGHVLVVYLVSQFFPNNVVLGNHLVSPLMGLVYSMVVFTLIAVGALPIVEYVSEVQQKRLSTLDWMILYAVINTVGLWVVARFAEQLGLGLSSWMVAVSLGIVLDFVQGLLIMKAT